MDTIGVGNNDYVVPFFYGAITRVIFIFFLELTDAISIGMNAFDFLPATLVQELTMFPVIALDDYTTFFYVYVGGDHKNKRVANRTMKNM